MKAGLRKGPDRLGGDGKKAATMRAELASMVRLSEMSTRLTATTDLSSILYEMLDAIIELQSADFGDVQLYDDATGTLKIVAHRGLGQGFLDYFTIVDAKDTSACGMALRSGTHIIIEDVNSDPAFEPHRGIAASTGFRSVQSTPLFDQNSGKPVGMLSTHFRKPHRPSDHELRLTDTYARQAADLIAYRLAEQRLRENEEHLRLALEAALFGTWEWDSKTNLFVADARQRSFFGLPPQEGALPAEVYWRQMVPEEINNGLETVHSALQEDGAFQNEQRVIRPDGQIVWLLSRGQAKHSDPSRVIGVSFDITERKRTESALLESEAQLSAILNQVPGAVGLFDQQGKFLLRAGTLSGWWDETIPSHDPSSTGRWRGFDAMGGPLPPSQYPGARALRGETVTPGTDFLHMAEDGRETWIRVSAAPFRDHTNRIVGGVSILQNVDAEKRADHRLRESEARLQAAVDLVKLGLYAWDPQTNELQWDETLKAMWGLPADALVTYDVWRAGVHPDDLARVEAAIQQCADPAGDGVYDIEYRVIGQADGVQRWIATRGRTQFEHDKPVSFYGVALDVTDRKRVESRLERRVDVRTRELETVNRQLRAQIEQRETAEAVVHQLQRLEAIGQITSGVAHDFNNLLSVVLMNARLLLHKPRDELDKEGLELVAAAAERGAKLTGQLLAFSRKQRLEPRAVDLNAMISGLDDLLGVTLGGRVQLNKTFAPDLPLAMVDPNQIELTVLNLALNARDAMQPGGTLVLETFNAVVEREPSRPEEPAPGEYVVLAVNDTGTGISDDVFPRVFEPFFTTKEPGKGSGLGLSQIVGFAKQSGGGVRIDTRVGEGTSVKVFLPRATGFLSDGEREAAVAEKGPQATTLRILVVDDDEAVLNSTLRMLDFLGYAAFSAGSGDEALSLVGGKLDVDIVLADFAMPRMSGVELAKALRLLRPTLPVILVTGYADLDVLKRLDGSQILQKPYSHGDLVEKIKVALGTHTQEVTR